MSTAEEKTGECVVCATDVGNFLWNLHLQAAIWFVLNAEPDL